MVEEPGLEQFHLVDNGACTVESGRESSGIQDWQQSAGRLISDLPEPYSVHGGDPGHLPQQVCTAAVHLASLAYLGTASFYKHCCKLINGRSWNCITAAELFLLDLAELGMSRQ